MVGGKINFLAHFQYSINSIAESDYRELLLNIFNSGQLGMAFTNSDGTILSSNEEFFDIIEKEHDNLFHFTAGVPVQCIKPDLLEYTLGTSSAAIKLYQMKLKQASPDAVAYLWFSSPVHDHFRNRVRILKNLYRSFINNTFELVFRTTLLGKILFSNRLFIRSFGFESNFDIKNVSMNSLFETADDYLIFKQRLIIEKRISNEVINFVKRDGHRLIGLVNCQLHNDENGEEVLNWTVLDVSQQNAYEHELTTKNQQLEKVNSQMEKFLYSASHDLRSPMTSIFGLVNLLRIESNDPVVHEYASKIEHCTSKLDNIMKDIMNFSKTTYQCFSSEQIDFENMLWKLINSQYSDPNFKKIQFEVKVEGTASFHSDHNRIEVILENLIRNAITFFDANKVKPFVRIYVDVTEQEARLQIIDNGIGIAPDHVDNIFNMFYRSSDRSRGSGLGLYIVKESVQQLKARIQVESEVGFGSIFRLNLPNDSRTMFSI